MTKPLRIKSVAALTGLSVRTLHHYDAVGLLVPSHRTAAGHRLYTDADLARLQLVLVRRALGFSLDEIRRSLDEPGFDLREALQHQRRELTRHRKKVDQTLRAVDAALAALGGEHPAEGRKTMFEGIDPKLLEQEAEQKWGQTPQFRESRRRTQRYTQADWAALQREAGVIYAELAVAAREGASPKSARVQALVERHRAHLDRWFYPCDRAMHGRLADGYEADERFAKTMDQAGPGVTALLVAGIRAAS